MAREVLCDECNLDAAENICPECGMWLCEVCVKTHECLDDFVDPATGPHDLAAWNQRVAEAWNLPQRRSGGDGGC